MGRKKIMAMAEIMAPNVAASSPLNRDRLQVAVCAKISLILKSGAKLKTVKLFVLKQNPKYIFQFLTTALALILISEQ